MIYVVATISIETGKREAFLAELHANVPRVLSEDGCLEYVPTVDVPTDLEAQGEARADVVTVMEKWRDLAALEAHLIAPHMLEYRKKVKQLVKGASLQILEPTSS